MGNSDWCGERGAKRAKRWCNRIQLEVFNAWVPTGPQPRVGPGGQGEVGLPRKYRTIFRGAPKRGFPEGLSFPPPSPRKMKAPALSTKFPWRWRVYGGGAPGREEGEGRV